MERISEKQLERLAERINKLTNSPTVSWTKHEKGVKANIGNYHIDYAYGKVGLCRMLNEGGGVQSVIGLSTKRELWDKMQAFILGLEHKQQS
jgi:hypothetical protein